MKTKPVQITKIGILFLVLSIMAFGFSTTAKAYNLNCIRGYDVYECCICKFYSGSLSKWILVNTTSTTFKIEDTEQRCSDFCIKNAHGYRVDAGASHCGPC